MQSNNRALVPSLMLTPSPPVDLSIYSSFQNPLATLNVVRTNIGPTCPGSALRYLTTPLEQYAGQPSSLSSFLNAPFETSNFMNALAKIWPTTLSVQLASFRRAEWSTPCSVEENVTGPVGKWLDSSRFDAMPVRREVSDTNRGHLSRTKSWNKRWLHWIN